MTMVERMARAMHDADFIEACRTEEHYRSDPFYEQCYTRYARAALLAALDAEDEALARVAGKALYDSAANRAGRHRPDLDMRPFEQQSDDMQRAWTEDGAAVIASLRSLAQGA